jgi:molecular chaperone GrpE
MSKNKEKHHSHEDAEKNHASSADHASAPGGRITDDGQRTMDDRRQTTNDSPGGQPAHRPVRHSFSEGGSPEGKGGTADGGQRTTDDGRQTAPDKAADQVEKLAQLQDRLLRFQADFDNFRKRTLREKNELFDSANQALMLELLPVLDHLQLGIQAASAHQTDPAFREGLTMIFDQLMGVLSKFGLSPMETDNQVFDPNRFEAVNTLPSATEPEGTVLALVRRGYMLRNKLLRPAQVIVSSGPPPEEIKNAE